MPRGSCEAVGPSPSMAPLVSEYRNGRLVSSSGTSGGTGQRSGGGADRALWLRVTSVLQDAFLPEGYPESVSPDYLSKAWPRASCVTCCHALACPNTPPGRAQFHTLWTCAAFVTPGGIHALVNRRRRWSD